jgi:hypothetical protein
MVEVIQIYPTMQLLAFGGCVVACTGFSPRSGHFRPNSFQMSLVSTSESLKSQIFRTVTTIGVGLTMSLPSFASDVVGEFATSGLIFKDTLKISEFNG